MKFIKTTSTKKIKSELNKLIKIISNKNFQKNSSEVVNKSNYFNCWGFTAFVHGWVDNLEWLYGAVMEGLLKYNSKKIKTPREGDIFVIRTINGDELIHTGIILDTKKEKVLHKPGPYDLEINNLNNAVKEYLYEGDLYVTYRRPKKKLKKIV